jgi:uncharacterized protein
MNAHDTRVLKQFASRLRVHLPQSRIWAFGSRARGEANEESDMDVCVVVEGLTRDTRNLIRQVAWETGFENDLVITTVKYSKQAFEHGPSSVSPLVQTILREGVPA